MRRRPAFALALAIASAVAIAPGAAAPADDLRSVFTKFVAAQNAHDIRAVEPLLLDSPQFLWITRGVPVWGRDEALKKFAILFQGTWHLEPDPEVFRIVQVRGDMAHIFVPVVFTIGAPGQPARRALIYVNQTLVKIAGVWRIASILPVTVPTPRE